MNTKNHSDTYAKISLQRISLLILSDLKQQRCPDTPLYAEFSKLDIEISTSDFVFNELNAKQQMLVKSLSIDIYTLDSDELMTFFTEYQALGQVKISSQDYSIYYFAKKYNAHLLSNDKALRKFSNNNNVDVKGIFYILDLIIEQSQLSRDDLRISIALLLNNSWLPKDEINIRLERLK